MPLTNSPDPSASFRRILTRNLTLPLVLGVASAVAFLSLLAYLAAAITNVQHSDELLAQASVVQKLDLEMESGVRGFLLNGDERYLKQVDDAKAHIR